MNSPTETSSRMLAEIYAATRDHADWAEYNIAAAPAIHIAVMSEPFLSYVFEGRKTVESRFSLHRIAPYGTVQPGDIVCMKAGPIVGCFGVAWVRTYDLRDFPIEAIATEYGGAICADEQFWRRKSSKRYATLMGIEHVQRLTPIRIAKQDRRAWVTL